jgi:hypothetical protein
MIAFDLEWNEKEKRFVAANKEKWAYRASTGFATATGLTMWAHDGSFWIAIKSLGAGQNVRVYRSNTGKNWGLVKNLGYSAVAPSAVSYWNTGNNVVLTFPGL